MIDPDLARAIDACCASLLADAAADETDPVRAAGYRWLMENRKWPVYEELYGGWDWASADEDDRPRAKHHPNNSMVLPVGATDRIPAWHRGDKPPPPYRASPSAALDAAALAVGTWLAREAAAPDAQKEAQTP